jgi:hypothetical protein
VKALNLTGDNPIKVSNSIENDKDKKKDEKKDNNEFVRIKDLKIARRSPPRKQSLRYIIDTSSDKEAFSKRPRRNSYARKAPKKSL